MIRALAAVALVLVVPAASGGPRRAVEPNVVVWSFVAAARTHDAQIEVTWRSPDNVAVRSRDPDFRSFVQRGGTLYEAALGPSAGAVTRRTYSARPDAYSLAEELLGNEVDFVLAEARAGKLRLHDTTTSTGAPPDWTANILLRANDCAGLRGTAATVIIDRPTLLPLGIRSRRGITSIDYYGRINARTPASAFRIPDVGRAYRRDQGFVRTSPARAAGPLPYVPELPTALPKGFKLAVSGWARRSGRTGPEASNPRYPYLFGAVYRRGWERIDVTQRLAGKQGWLSDPFGIECGFQVGGPVRVGGVQAFYGAGPEIAPHLYWRRGRLLYTVSGPLPKRDLVAIAESLEPLGR
ncbi:MAG: hypothetical protein ABR583_07170 [Gaiellaceae bacterium]